MASEPDTEPVDDTPQRRKPLVAGTGWLLFVCAFLPTVQVCSDPIAPYQFPPVYVVHLGAAAFAIIAAARTLRARRAWFTVSFVLWFVTAVAWVAMFLVDAGAVAALVLVVGGLFGAVASAKAFHRKKYTPRGMWIGAIIHGAISIIWYVVLSIERGALWGAYAGLTVSVAFATASVIALGQHTAELERKRRENEPAPLPVARVV